MRQIFQDLRNGEVTLVNVPAPSPGPGQLLIRTRISLISAGTERMLLDFGQAGWVAKARQQPDKVRMVLEKAVTDGVFPTIESVRAKIDQPLPLGYCNVGEILAVGHGVEGFTVGSLVASNGHHAEIVCVPQNLCAPLPEGVSAEQGAFAVLGAIALQGVRLSGPTLGESFAVIGLGLVGLLTVQLLRANGCRVLGIDLDSAKCDLAREFGAETVAVSAGQDPLVAAESFTAGQGIDGVVITATTRSSDPVHQAATMCRKRGRIVLVGVTGLELSRADFYEKELSFQVSCSYGPGRYDPAYEDDGHDYPLGFVRWTEQRNIAAILDQFAAGRLDVERLISARFRFGEAAGAYRLLGDDRGALGILLDYPSEPGESGGRTVRFASSPAGLESPRAATEPSIAFIGAGNYASRTLIPAFREGGAQLAVIASRGGADSALAARRFGIRLATTDIAAALSAPDVNTVVITTRHDSHADLVCRALQAGKNVFVEKPLCLGVDELQRIEEAHAARVGSPAAPLLIVGFNRRFAPQVQKMKALLEGVDSPKALVMTVNAGSIPAAHWVQDPVVGGGRIIGEACHFVDLLRFLVGRPITTVESTTLPARTADTATLQLAFEDGSIGTVHYFANGSKAFPKERLEVFAAGRILQLDNFRRLRGFGWPGFRKEKLWSQDKGQTACVAAFLAAIRGGSPAPIPFTELVEVSRATIAAAAFAPPMPTSADTADEIAAGLEA